MYVSKRSPLGFVELLDQITMQREETASAIVERVHSELAICRYHSGARVDASALGENLKARMRVAGREAYAVIAIFPENVDFDMNLLERNLYTDLSLNEVTRVLAIVALGALYDPIASLHSMNHLTSVANRVFRTEVEARAWVEMRIAEHAQGSLGGNLPWGEQVGGNGGALEGRAEW